jgi:hypothetical protein
MKKFKRESIAADPVQQIQYSKFTWQIYVANLRGKFTWQTGDGSEVGVASLFFLYNSLLNLGTVGTRAS